MKLVNPHYFDVIELSDENPETLVIENPHVFKDVLQALILQSEVDVGEFVLSESDTKILSLSKYTMVLTDIFNYDTYSKQLKTKLTNIIVSNYSEIDGKEKVIGDINELGVKIMNSLPYSVSFKSAISFTDVVKFLDFSFDFSEYEFWDRFTEYISTAFELLNFKLLVTINLKDYVDHEEYVELMKFFLNKKIPLLMIERHQHEELDDISYLTIIDKDLCVL
ncbi:MAG: type II-A CRISPR-associated protein Csn2 [Bulleidia sp.]|nr:type II-A CRISPR-associated protein Csn2 [Bulleidia sp.]